MKAGRTIDPRRWRRAVVRILGGLALAGAVAMAAASLLVPPEATAAGSPRTSLDPAASGGGSPRDGPLTPPELAGHASGSEGADASGHGAIDKPPPCPRVAPSRVIALNSASQTELETLPGIGPTKAQRIVAWRARHGRFRRIIDLRRVKGFGRKTVMRLAPHLLLDAPRTPIPAGDPTKEGVGLIPARE